jgi:hypothetical protein
MSTQNVRTTYTFTQFTNACFNNYHRSMSGLCHIATEYLETSFFPTLLDRAPKNDDSVFIMKREHISDYVANAIKEKGADLGITVQWGLDDFTSQVMLFIVAALKGVPVLYTDGEDIVVNNPVYQEKWTDHKYFNVVLCESEGGKNGEIHVDLNVGLPTGYYDPTRSPANKQIPDKLPDSDLE